MSPSTIDSPFREVQRFKSEFCPSSFALYESNRTGMRVITVDQKGPKVYGYFALATEIHDDSGSPHTLEHLVFMGSKNYKYQGLLSKLATRAYSDTNAWTATDHTAYTLETAGWDGFAQILPVYLEHILLPTLTDAGCYTEVHHIDGTGHDAGVVYSEMQGCQNEQTEIMELRARRLLYPQHSGFRSETGGLMDQLRMLTADQNLCLILIGEIDHPHLFQVLDKFEESIKNDVPPIGQYFERPWSKTGKTPALKESILETTEFPETDESMGEILIGFFGPDINDDLLNDALNILLVYLCGSSVSLLENVLVENEQLASGVSYTCDAKPDVVIWFTLHGVETEKLTFVENRFFEVLKSSSEAPLDMEYLSDCIERQRRQLKFYSESSGNFFADQIVSDHLFGARDGSTLLSMGTLNELDVLATWDETAWKTCYKRWFLDANHVSVVGVPSKKLAKKMKDVEEARVKAQQERLGKDGLEKLAKKLEEAKAENEAEIPKELFEKFSIPKTESIHFIPTTTARSGLARNDGILDNNIQRKIDQENSDLLLFLHFEHIPTNFVRINLFLCTHHIPLELRPLLPLYIANFFETPVMRGGVRVEFEDAVTRLEKDTIGYAISFARGFGNSEILSISMEVEPEKYDTAISWLKTFLFQSIFDESRLKSTLSKILADIPEEKRGGDSMAASVLNLLHYSRDSSSRTANTLVKSVCLRRAIELLKSSPEIIISKLETIRAHLTVPSNFRVLVVANLDSQTSLPAPVSSWNALTSAMDMTDLTLQPLDSVKATLSPAGKNPGTLAYIVPMQTIDTSYARFVTPCPDSYADPSLPAFYVALAYLNAMDGPMWAAVRGTGLAYGANFSKSVETGRLQFVIYQSPDAHRAFRAAKAVVADLASNTLPLDPLELEGAVSSIVVGFADEQPTMGSACAVSFANQVIKGIPKDWGQGFLKKVREVTDGDVRRVLKELVGRVFEAGSADLVVTCAEIMKDGMLRGFLEDGFKAEVRPLAYFKDDYGMEGAELVDETVEDEEEDEEDEGDTEAGEDEDASEVESESED